MSASTDNVLPAEDQLDKLARRRRFKDRLVNGAIGGGGMFVLLAITVIFSICCTRSGRCLNRPRSSRRAAT